MTRESRPVLGRAGRRGAGRGGAAGARHRPARGRAPRADGREGGRCSADVAPRCQNVFGSPRVLERLWHSTHFRSKFEGALSHVPAGFRRGWRARYGGRGSSAPRSHPNRPPIASRDAPGGELLYRRSKSCFFVIDERPKGARGGRHRRRSRVPGGSQGPAFPPGPPDAGNSAPWARVASRGPGGLSAGLRPPGTFENWKVHQHIPLDWATFNRTKAFRRGGSLEVPARTPSVRLVHSAPPPWCLLGWTSQLKIEGARARHGPGGRGRPSPRRQSSPRCVRRKQMA